MICYRDTTFCMAAKQCETQDCYRRIDEYEYEKSDISDCLPIAWADFRETCDKYKEKKDENR